MLPLLDALDHIHSLPEPILHRDIKPANIYLTGRQTPILLDFGAARVRMGHQSRSLSAVLTPRLRPVRAVLDARQAGPLVRRLRVCGDVVLSGDRGRAPGGERSSRGSRLESAALVGARPAPQSATRSCYGLGFRPEERPQSARAFADLDRGTADAAAGHPSRHVDARLRAGRCIGQRRSSRARSWSRHRPTALPRTEIAPTTTGGAAGAVTPPESSLRPSSSRPSHTARAAIACRSLAGRRRTCARRRRGVGSGPDRKRQTERTTGGSEQKQEHVRTD